MAKLKIKLFGQIKSELNTDYIFIDQVKDTNSLTNKIYDLYPTLKNIKFSLAVDKEIINSNISLNESSEIAFLPPYSGG